MRRDVAPLPTSRLLLRRWRDSDREPFAALNADPVVMEHFPAPLTRAESDAFLDRTDVHFEQHGFGLWAVELASTGEFLGFTGLAIPTFEASFTPCVEVGWRLSAGAWGCGYATEAATAALDAGFGAVGLTEIVSFTAMPNVRSQRVMQRLGMTHDPAEDFDHVRVAQDSPLRRHVLYRMTAEQWRSRGRGR